MKRLFNPRRPAARNHAMDLRIRLAIGALVMGALGVQTEAQSTFLPEVRIGPGAGPACIEVRAPYDVGFADLNGDGDTDFIFPYSFCPSLYVTLSDGVGGYLPETSVAYAFGAPMNGPLAVEMLDVDGDGRQDVITSFRQAGSSMSFVYWLRSTGTGALEAPVALSGPIPGTLAVIRVTDLDGDGLEEIVTSSQGGQEGLVLARATAGAPFAKTTLFTAMGGLVQGLDVGDLDRDGDEDLVFAVQGPMGGVHAVENLGAGTFGAPTPLSAMEQSSRVALLDLDSDGRLDIAYVGRPFNQAPLLNTLRSRLQGSQPFGLWSAAVAPAGPAGEGLLALEAGDIDLDGDDDLLAFREVGEPRVYINRGPLDFQPNDYGWGSQSRFWYYAGLYDVNADGALDAVVAGFEYARLYTQVNPIAGDAFCNGASNSTGSVGTLTALGSSAAADNNLRLAGRGLPPMQFGIGIVSMNETAGYQPAGTSGTLCIGTAQGAGLGRYDAPGEVFMVSGIGLAELAVDLSQTPSPMGLFAAAAGDTLHFQLWHRDQVAGTGTSNFSEAVRVTLR